MIASLNDVWRRQDADGIPEQDADADTDPIANLFDYADNLDDVRENLMVHNDEPPYNHDLMLGASSSNETVVSSIMRTSTGAGALARGPGFCAPFGLIEVVTTRFGATDPVGEVELILEMVPGSYHGTYAERVI